MNHALVQVIAAVTILLILIRPLRVVEAVWACSGAALLVIFRLISPGDALSAVWRGADVYLFLTGMMMLAELARHEGFFDWIAVIAVRHAKGSPARLFVIIYLVGTLVTIFLSNDATAVVLTPAVMAVLRKARREPLPYLLICAFIANAASFVLPISNPANLVVYGSGLPPLGAWLLTFGLPSFVAIAATFVALRWSVRQDLRGVIDHAPEPVALSSAGTLAAWGIAFAGVVLIFASAFHADLGLPTLLSAVLVTGLVALKDRPAPRHVLKDISWSVIPLVAGLFVLVEATSQAGALSAGQAALQAASTLGRTAGTLSAAAGTALLSNIANNLPIGLFAAGTLHNAPVSSLLRNAVLIGVDLGPNLSVSGSLATILWLSALRRDGENISFAKFLRYGLVVMPPALALAVLALQASYIQ